MENFSINRLNSSEPFIGADSFAILLHIAKIMRKLYHSYERNETKMKNAVKTPQSVVKFTQWLHDANLSQNTVLAYEKAVEGFYRQHARLTKDNLLSYREYLIANFAPKTVNLLIQGLNKYLTFLGKPDLRLKTILIPRKTFVDNVISLEDYLFLKNQLRAEQNMQWYFVVRYLAATGARVSELVQIKIEHIPSGHVDIYAKGGKLRRLYIPTELGQETLRWLKECHRETGYLFINRYGNRISTRGIYWQLKKYGERYGLNPQVVYPHSFRHMYAKAFLRKQNDLSLLADLLGHESIETTRIYLRQSATEQHDMIDRIVTW